MTDRHYGDFVVHGGNVHAGDNIFNFNISNELSETVSSCRVIDSALSRLLDPPSYSEDIRSDIEELLDVINTLQACVDDGINENCMSSMVRNNLLDLWTSCRAHQDKLFEIRMVIEMSSSNSPSHNMRASYVQYAGLRGALRGLRRRLNTSIAILHLSTVQSLRLTSEEHWSRLRRQIENIQEQLESQATANLPMSLPISKTNLSQLRLPEDTSLGMRRLLHTDSLSIRSNDPSMQVSIIQASSLSPSDTYVSAMEYHSNTVSRAATILPATSSTIRPLHRLLFSKTRISVPPELTTFHAADERQLASGEVFEMNRLLINQHGFRANTRYSIVGFPLTARDAWHSVQGQLTRYRALNRGLDGKIREQRARIQRLLRRLQMDRPHYEKIINTVKIGMLPLVFRKDEADSLEQNRAPSRQGLRDMGVKVCKPRSAPASSLRTSGLEGDLLAKPRHERFRQISKGILSTILPDVSELKNSDSRKDWPTMGIILVEMTLNGSKGLMSINQTKYHL